MSASARRQLVRFGVHHFDAELAELGAHGLPLQQGPFGGGRPEHLGRRRPRSGASRPACGSRTDGDHHHVLLGQLRPPSGAAPPPARRHPARSAAPPGTGARTPHGPGQGSCAQSSSISSASSGAIAWTSCPSRLPLAAEPARARVPAVEGEEVHAVPAAFGEHRQQQRRLDAGVQPRLVARSARRRCGRCPA